MLPSRTPNNNQRASTPRPPTRPPRPASLPPLLPGLHGLEQVYRPHTPAPSPQSPSIVSQHRKPKQVEPTNHLPAAAKPLPEHPALTTRLNTLLTLASSTQSPSFVPTNNFIWQTYITALELVTHWRHAAEHELAVVGHAVEEFKAREGMAWRFLDDLRKLAKEVLDDRGREGELVWQLGLLVDLMKGECVGRVRVLENVLAGGGDDDEDGEEGLDAMDLVEEDVDGTSSPVQERRVELQPSPARRPVVVKVREPRSLFFEGERELEEMLTLEARRVDVKQGPERRPVVVKIKKTEKRESTELGSPVTPLNPSKAERRFVLERIEERRASHVGERGGLR